MKIINKLPTLVPKLSYKLRKELHMDMRNSAAFISHRQLKKLFRLENYSNRDDESERNNTAETKSQEGLKLVFFRS